MHRCTTRCTRLASACCAYEADVAVHAVLPVPDALVALRHVPPPLWGAVSMLLLLLPADVAVADVTRAGSAMPAECGTGCGGGRRAAPRRDRTRYVQTNRAIIDIHDRPHALGARLTLLWLPRSMCRTLCCPCVMGRLLFCMLSPCCCGRCLADGAGADVPDSVVALRHVARAVSHAVSMLLRLLSG